MVEQADDFLKRYRSYKLRKKQSKSDGRW